MVLTSLRAASPAGLPALIRVLVVDRSPASARAARNALESEAGIRLHVARGPGSAARLIEREPFDAMLIEDELWADGLSIIGRVVREERPDMAVILLTDDPAPPAGLGAHGSLSRDALTRDDLVANLTSAVSESRGARRRETMVRWLERDARSDRTTGLFNRAAFNERLRDACRASTIAGTPVTVIAIEVDTDASGRDEHGAINEPVMRRAAEGVTRAIRSSDFAARAGDRLLAVILPEADLAFGRRVARRMAHEVERLNAEAWPEDSPVGLGFGVATAIAHDPLDLFAAAEANLRQASGSRRPAIVPGGREEIDGPSVA